MKKVMFICSAGGHLSEILMVSKIFKNYNYLLVTEKNKISLNLKTKYNMYYLTQGSRNEILKYPFVCLINIVKSIIIFFKFKPDLIYTTGAHTSVFMCILAHIFKKKIIFIEVYDRINNPSLTAKILYKIADKFIVQHKEMLKIFPNATYIGGIY